MARRGGVLQPGRPPSILLGFSLIIMRSPCSHTKKQTFSNSNNTPCPRVLAAALKRFLSANPPTHFPCISPSSAVAKLSPELQVGESTYASSFLFCETVSHWNNNISPFYRTVLDNGQRSNKGDCEANYRFLISEGIKNVVSLLLEGLMAYSWSIKEDSGWKVNVSVGDSNGHCEKKEFWKVIGMHSFIGHQDLRT
jgi:hypothetical protein